MKFCSFSYFVLIFLAFRNVFAVLIDQTDQIQRQKEEELFEKHLKHVSSDQATPAERAQLIRDGLRNVGQSYGRVTTSKPDLASSDFDCKIKGLAYDFAKKLEVGTGTSEELKYIFDGLELGSKCNQIFADFLPKRHEAYFKSKSSDDIQIFVDLKNVGNEFDGSYRNPFRTIQEGIDACTLSQNQHTQNSNCNVHIRSGIYKVSKALLIQQSNIQLRAYNGESVVVTSDEVITIPKWNLYESKGERYTSLNPLFEGIEPKQSTKSITYYASYKTELDCENACFEFINCTAYAFFGETTGNFADQCYMRNDGKWNTIYHSGVVSGKKVRIYYANLQSFKNLSKVDQVFIGDRRAIRARFPNANPETEGLHTVPTGYVDSAEKWLEPHAKPDATEIQIDSPIRLQTLFPKFYIGIDGPVDQFQPPQSYWGVKKPVGGGGVTYRVPSGLQYSENLEFNGRQWKNPKTGIVHVYQHYHWGNWMYRLDDRDQENHTLHWTWGGFQEARGANDGKEWYVENIFEELDSANEWFFDEKERYLYYSPNLTASDLPEKIAVPQLSSLLIISGSQSKPVENVSVRGITFQHTTQTFLEPYMVPSGGDWSVHPNGAVYVEGSEKVTIDSCTFDSPGGNGIFVRNYNRDTLISHNLFYRLGDNGIVLVGDSKLIDGTSGNQPRKISVLYNLLFENGIWGKQTYPFVQSRSCEVLVEGNVFFNGPRAGININDGFGGGNTINNNLLFNFVRETDDHGPINTWDRVPYLTKVSSNKVASFDVKENEIHRNFIVNNYRSVWPIDHDDGTCFWNDTHNYLVYGGFKNYLGHDKHSMHNIYVYPDKHPGKGASMSFRSCAQTAGQTLGTSGYGDIYASNTCIINKTSIYQLGNCDAKHIFATIPIFVNNHYYTGSGTITLTCGSETWTLEEMKVHGLEAGTLVEKLVEDETVIKWGKDLLGL